MEIRQVNIFYYFIDRNKRGYREKLHSVPNGYDIQRTNNEIIEIDDKQASPRYTIDIYLSSTYVLTSLPNLLFHRIYRLSRHHTRTFTGKHLFFSTRSCSANHRHPSFRNSISSPGICQKRLQRFDTMYNDLKKTTIEITNFRFENDEFSKRKEKKRKGGGGGGMRREQVEKYRDFDIGRIIDLSFRNER